MADREFDFVLFGATGFTGGLTAEYLARHAPADARWALAGRNIARLQDVRARLAAAHPAVAELPLLTADSTDELGLLRLAERAGAIASTVGPYLRYGEPLVAACAASGTDYLDLTGEAEFVDQMYVRHHRRATQTGARLLHCCGFDSIPTDLGVYYTVRQLPDDQPISIDGVVRAGGQPSGGTTASALTALSRLRQSASAAAARRRIDLPPASRTARAVPAPPKRSDGLWLLPLPAIDATVVQRSARALAGYGPRFTYHHYAGFRRLPVAVLGGVAAGGLVLAAQLGPARQLLLSRLAPGTGPSEERRAQGWFRTRFTATCGDQVLHTEVSGGDPGYTETAKMLAESLLCVAFDDLPPSSGQVTTAVAMGDALLARLQAAGIDFGTVAKASRGHPRQPVASG